MKKFIYLALIIACFSCKKDNDTTNNSNDSNKEDTSKLNNQESNSLENQESSIEFGNLFNEGTIIKFTPKDLENPKDEEEIKFKEKLASFEKEHLKKEDFENDNLLNLVNNETFENSEYFINSEWLNYFIEKYSINNKLKEIMIAAINQEDYNAVKIILKTGYIVSIDEVKLSTEVLSNTLANLEINKNRKGLDENGETIFYNDSKSKSKQINELLKKKYNYFIFDKDGQCNLRDDEFSNSYVKGQVKSGEHIDIINNENQDWLYIKTKDNKEGYVHKSRIVSK
ncbi:MAG: SH3 domain-containing protein [Limnohabitans sp.]|nr:SH3 domain-containing protein [Limnohabitans sp.]